MEGTVNGRPFRCGADTPHSPLPPCSRATAIRTKARLRPWTSALSLACEGRSAFRTQRGAGGGAHGQGQAEFHLRRRGSNGAGHQADNGSFSFLLPPIRPLFSSSLPAIGDPVACLLCCSRAERRAPWSVVLSAMWDALDTRRRISKLRSTALCSGRLLSRRATAPSCAVARHPPTARADVRTPSRARARPVVRCVPLCAGAAHRSVAALSQGRRFQIRAREGAAF